MPELDKGPSNQPEPTSHAEFGARLGPVGEVKLKASLSGRQARDLLPLIGVVAVVVGPALMLLVGHLAGLPWGISILMSAIVLCGIVFMIKKCRT